MLRSIIVYGFMIFSMFLCGKAASLYPKYRIVFIMFSILIFTVFAGLRYDVGVDYMTYRSIFQSFCTEFSNKSLLLMDHSRYEIGFLGIVLLCANLGLGPDAIFAVFALIQIGCVYYVFKDDRNILPYIGLTLIAGGSFFFWMNAVRQITAFTLFLPASVLLYRKKYLPAFLFALSACLMHKSAVMFCPFLILLPIFQKGIPTVKLQVVLFLASILLSNLQIWNYFSDTIASILAFMGDFGERYSSENIFDVNSDLDFGLRAAIIILLDFMSIVFSRKISKVNHPVFNYFYNIFFIGVVAAHLFSDNHYLTRFTMYFSSMSFIVYSYLLSYLSRYSNGYHRIIKAVLVLLLMLYLLRTIQADDGTASILYQFSI